MVNQTHRQLVELLKYYLILVSFHSCSWPYSKWVYTPTMSSCQHQFTLLGFIYKKKQDSGNTSLPYLSKVWLEHKSPEISLYFVLIEMPFYIYEGLFSLLKLILCNCGQNYAPYNWFTISNNRMVHIFLQSVSKIIWKWLRLLSL